MRVIRGGDTGPHVKKLQAAINKRLSNRAAGNHRCEEDGVFGTKTRIALIKACYLLGMRRDRLNELKHGLIVDSTQRFVMEPGLRKDAEKRRGRQRVKKHRAAVKRHKAEAAKANDARKRICREAKKAAANYRKNPGAYHYLAGGKANLVYLTPSPRDYRSDCSQFAAAVFHGAGLPSPARPLAHEWASTYSIVKAEGARIVSSSQRKPGMLAMYGSREAPHHVEIWCGDRFVGHGSPPIDSITPGQPDYYVDFDFLN